MRATLVIAGAALAVLAAASLIAILFVEPSPPPPAAEPATILPEVAAAVAAAKEAAVKEAAAKQAADEAAAREQAAKEAAARQAAVEAAAKEAAKELAAKEADVSDGGASSGGTPGAVGTASRGVSTSAEPHQGALREGRAAASPSGAPAKGREQPSTAAIIARLDELKPRLSQCYETAARSGANPSAGSPGAASERPVAPIFIVELEGAGEHYRVVDADVDSRGSAEDAVLECMQAVLLATTVSTPGMEIVDRLALRFSP